MLSATVLPLLFEHCKMLVRFVELTFKATSQQLWNILYLKADILEVS